MTLSNICCALEYPGGTQEIIFAKLKLSVFISYLRYIPVSHGKKKYLRRSLYISVHLLHLVFAYLHTIGDFKMGMPF